VIVADDKKAIKEAFSEGFPLFRISERYFCRMRWKTCMFAQQTIGSATAEWKRHRFAVSSLGN